MKKLALFFNDRPTASPRDIADFCRSLLEAGMMLFLEFPFGDFLSGHSRMKGMERLRFFSDIPSDIDIAVSIGGDGTLLRTARRIGEKGIPLVGVNAGHLGFLTQYTLEEGAVLASDIRNDSLKLEQRMILQLHMKERQEEVWPYAVNEVAVLKEDSASMLEVDAYVDDRYVADYMADGLLVSTPGGSTAYALAAGGPIIEPGVDTMLIVPVAPHTLTLRPMVVSGDCTMRLEARSRTGRCRISIDGCSFPVDTPCRLSLTRAPFSLPLLCRPDYCYFATLRHKLHWAQR